MIESSLKALVASNAINAINDKKRDQLDGVDD